MASSNKKRTITVKVTKKHLSEGMPGEANSCPIALALKGRGYRHVSVSDSVELTTKNGFLNFVGNLPKRALNFISRFDNSVEGKAVYASGRKRPFKSFSFKLTLKPTF